MVHIFFILSLVLLINELAYKGACCAGKRTVRESEEYSSAREQCEGTKPYIPF